MRFNPTHNPSGTITSPARNTALNADAPVMDAFDPILSRMKPLPILANIPTKGRTMAR